MMEIGNGGPAFPCEQHETQDNTWNQTFEQGMTLRDYFAAKAMAGMLAAGTTVDIDGERMFSTAYCIADAMLATRKVRS